MTTSQSATRSTIDAEIAVAYLQHIRGCTTSRTLCSTVPRPTILTNEASPTRSEGVVPSLTLGYG